MNGSNSGYRKENKRGEKKRKEKGKKKYTYIKRKN